MLNISSVFRKYLCPFYAQQSNKFLPYFAFKSKKTLSKNVWKSRKSYKLKQKCSIKHSNELKNNTSNFSLIHIN
jgi:hypothetical protein